MKDFGVWAIALLLAFAVVFCQSGKAYSVLTHEQIIDSAWCDIESLLRHRFPGITEDQLRRAHAYAYGGSVIQDLGYYPLGNPYFSDLVHYVRSGDFVEALIKEARDINEYAFALGALAHYAGDSRGHVAVNAAVAKSYPKLRKKYGESVTYAADPGAHKRTEFGFEVLQVYRNHYTPQQYRDLIDFLVATPLLDRAFAATYGLRMSEVFQREARAVGTYRYAVSRFVPDVTRAAAKNQKKLAVLIKDTPQNQRFLRYVSHERYEKEFGNDYRKQRFGRRTVSVMVWIVPKIGPFKTLKFTVPTPLTAQEFQGSFLAAVNIYREYLSALKQGTALSLRNRNLDTGKMMLVGEYDLADAAYGKLARQLAEYSFSFTSTDLQQDILGYFSDLNAPNALKKNRKQWCETLQALEGLRALRNGN